MDKKGKIITGVIGMMLLSSITITGLIFSVNPIVLKQNQFTYELHEKIPTDAASYVKANEKVLNAVSVNLSNVEIDRVGVYEVYAEYSGKKYPFTINIRDSVEPIATLVQTKYEVSLNETLYAKDMIKEVVEDSSYKVYFDEEGKPEYKTFTEVKTYNDVFIIVEDEHGNKSQKLRVSVVVKNNKTKPIISGVNDSVIQVGTVFDERAGVKASSAIDGDLTSKIVISGSVNVNKVGTYTITYSVSDSSGHTTSKKRVISVQSDPVYGIEGGRDVANGPYLASNEIKERESVFLTIKRNLFTGSNELELIRQMNDYLVKYVDYVTLDDQGKKANSSYGVIINNVGTDQGFARAIMYMSHQQNIECQYVSGQYLQENRVWNIVKVGNYFYHIDIAMNKSQGLSFSLKTTQEMIDLGYTFDQSAYPVCNQPFNF